MFLYLLKKLYRQMEFQPADIHVMLQKWTEQEMSEADLVQALREKGLEEDYITGILTELKKKKAEIRQRTGFIAAGVGSFLCFISCVLTLINPLPEFREWILYGITSLGVVVVFIGFYYIFEP